MENIDNKPIQKIRSTLMDYFLNKYGSEEAVKNRMSVSEAEFAKEVVGVLNANPELLTEAGISDLDADDLLKDSHPLHGTVKEIVLELESRHGNKTQ